MTRAARMMGVGLALALAGPAAAASASPKPLTLDVAAHPGSGVGEPEIRVNPRDPANLFISEGSSDSSVSHDRGRTWRQVSLSNAGDNVSAAEPDGTFVYSSLDGRVRVSTDGGDTWKAVGNWVGAVQQQLLDSVPGYGGTLGCNAPEPGGPVSIDPEQGPGPHLIACDRPWLDADPQTGELYVSWTDHDDNSGGETGPWELEFLGCKPTILVSAAFQCGRQYVSGSIDGGRTWSPFHVMDSETYPAGGTGGFSGGPAAAHGVLATAYLASGGPGCNQCVVFETSRDGGAHWDQHPTPATGGPFSIATLDCSLLCEPYVAADPSRRGRYAFALFDADQTHLLVYVTGDYGSHWSGPASLAEPDGQARYHPWIAYGPTGALGAMWRTAYADGTYTVWAAVAPGGETRFAPPVQLTSQPSPGPVNMTPGDDASYVTLDGAYLHAAWGDRRGGSLGIHYGRYHYAADPAVRAVLRRFG